MVNPWRYVRSDEDMVLIYKRMRDDKMMACTDGRGTIWLDDRLTYEESRCALMHELIHIEYGHMGHQDEETEQAVRFETAKKLVEWPDLILAIMWGTNLAEVAREVGVTKDVLIDRLRMLRPTVRWALLSSAGQEIEQVIA